MAKLPEISNTVEFDCTMTKQCATLDPTSCFKPVSFSESLNMWTHILYTECVSMYQKL